MKSDRLEAELRDAKPRRAREQPGLLISPSAYRLDCLEPAHVAQSHGIRVEWERLLKATANPYAFYQSPIWWDHVLQGLTEGERCALVTASHHDGYVAGLVPVQICTSTLNYAIGSRTLRTAQLTVARILGSQPVLPEDEGLYAELACSILSSFPGCDAIEMPNVLAQSYCGRTVCSSTALRQGVLVCLPEPMTNLHLVALDTSFENYLAKFKTNTRCRLRRHVKRLRERGGGRLSLQRIEHEGEIEAFLDVAARLSALSRQYQRRGWRIENNAQERRKLTELANAGVLRSYYLRCGDNICAYLHGFQYNDCYYAYQTGFDDQFADYSPGTVLFFLVIQELFQYRRPKLVHLCSGEFFFKYLFGTEHLPVMRVLLLRKNISNYVLSGSHSALRSSLRAAKRLLQRRNAGDQTVYRQ